MLRVSMHQPNFLPYVGFFEKIARSDLFIIVDHVDFSKGKDNWQHRNRIRTPNEWQYITIPVSDHFNYKPFFTVTLNGNVDFKKKKHIKSIQHNYNKAEFFDDYFDSFREVYMTKETNLAEFNIMLIKWMLEKLKIKTKVIRSTELEFDRTLKKTDMIIELMKTVGGTHFLSGDGAKHYLEKEKFSDNGIKLEFQNFTPKPYPQAYPGFVPNLSAIDLLFNTGKDALKFIINSHK